MPQTKIQGKFYPLQHEEWLRACQELTPSQQQVLYYIRTLDPYGDGVKVTAAEIARKLSTKKKTVHRQTVSRALKELDAKGFIDLELLEVQVKINPKGYWCDEDKNEMVCEDTSGVMRHQGCVETPDAIVTHQGGSSDTRVDRDTPDAIVTHQAKPEIQSEQEVQNPKTIKTYSDFKDSLSESEREKFFNFVKEEIKDFKPQIKDLEAWLASKNQAGQNRWEVYYNNFLASLKKQSEDSQKRAIDKKYQQAWKAWQEELKQRSALSEEEEAQRESTAPPARELGSRAQRTQTSSSARYSALEGQSLLALRQPTPRKTTTRTYSETPPFGSLASEVSLSALSFKRGENHK
jgi:Fe2+ or Zn2+ uptake regulation protein